MVDTTTTTTEPTTETVVRHSYKKESQMVPGIDNNHLYIGGILLALLIAGFAVSQTPMIKNAFGNFFNKNQNQNQLPDKQSRVQYNNPMPQQQPQGFRIEGGQVQQPRRISREEIFQQAREAQALEGAGEDYGSNTISPADIANRARERNYPHVHQHTRGPHGNQIRAPQRPGPQYESPFGSHISGPS